jgi:hypothetical protein
MLADCYPQRLEAPEDDDRLLRVAGGWVRQTYDGETGELIAFPVTEATAFAWMLDHRKQLPAHTVWDGLDGTTLYHACGGWFLLPDLPAGQRTWVRQLTDIEAAAWLIENNQPLPPAMVGNQQLDVARAVDGGAGTTSSLPGDADTHPSPYRFQLLGEMWQISYKGVSGAFKNAKGFQYIARLLASPGRPISAIWLVNPGVPDLPAEHRPGVLDELTDRDGKWRSPLVGRTRQPILDGEAKEQYRQRMTALNAKIKEAEEDGDQGAAERYRTEFHTIADELKAASRPGRRDRELGPPTQGEKARQAVSQALNRAYSTLSGGSPPQTALIQHLRDSIRPTVNKSFTYFPQPDGLPWQL